MHEYSFGSDGNYYNELNEQVTGENLNLLNELYGHVPPAYRNDYMRLYLHANRYMSGINKKGKRVDLYSKSYSKDQIAKKHRKLLELALQVPTIKENSLKILSTKKITKKTLVALVVLLILRCSFRVGSHKPEKNDKNAHRGILYITKQHIHKIQKGVVLSFTGKWGTKNKCLIDHKHHVLHDWLSYLYGNPSKNYRIFHQVIAGQDISITSKDVNDYLKLFFANSVNKYTARDLRTYNVNKSYLKKMMYESKQKQKLSKSELKTLQKSVIDTVAHENFHTSAVCKLNYLNPLIVEYVDENYSKLASLPNHPHAVLIKVLKELYPTSSDLL